jgi:hypothetical protein
LWGDPEGGTLSGLGLSVSAGVTSGSLAMKSPFPRLVFRRQQRRQAAREEHRRTALGIEPLEIRRAFATYEIESILYGGASPVDGWSLFGMADTDNLTITTTNTSTPFTGAGNLTVHFGSQGLLPASVINVTDHTVTLTLPALSGITWNGTSATTYANIAFTDSGAAGPFNMSNNAFIAYPANITSISPSSVTVNDSANLTLVASDPQRGFGALPDRPFYFIFNGTTLIPASGSGAASSSTQLTVNVAPGVLNQTGNWSIQTTSAGGVPSGPNDSASFALVGNLGFAVESINYTIASITYQEQAITGWSYLGSGNDTINITLANGSTPFPANTTVFFVEDGNPSNQVSVTNLSPINGSMTLPVPVPYFGLYAGSTTNMTLSFGQAPNNDTTNGSFQYHNVFLQNLSPTQSYVAGGGTLNLTANSAVYGFGNLSQNVTVVFDGPKHLAVTGTPTSSTELSITMPNFGDDTAVGNYSVFLGAPANVNMPASNNLSLEVLQNPVIANLTVTFQNNTNLSTNGSPSNTTPPGINDFYLYVYGTVNNDKGWFDINATTGVVGTTPQVSANGVPFTNLNNSTLFFNLAGAAYNGTRVYLSTESTLQNQPTANFANSYYDFVEIAASNSSVFADTSQVDQFGMPMTLALSISGSNQTSTSGNSEGLTRQDILTGYNTYFQDIPGYNLAIVPIGGLGNATLSTYRVLAPNDLLNAITAEGNAYQQGNSTDFTISPQNGSYNGSFGNLSHWAYLNITTANSAINGTLYPAGSFVTGPWLPAGTVIAETNSSNTATSFIIGTNQTIANASPFQNVTINGTVATTVGGVRIQQVTGNMTSEGFQALSNAFGPSVFNYANGTPVAWDNATLNQNNAIDLMFNRYKSDIWWQEENQPASNLSNTTLYPQQVALYNGTVTTTMATSIENTSANYTVLRFIDYTSGAANTNLTFDIYYPYFTTNSPAGKLDPFGNPVPPPPAFFNQAEGNFKSPSLQVFGGAGIFQPGGSSTAGNAVALNDLGRDVAVAISRGYGATMLSMGEPIQNASNPNLAVFHHTNPSNTTGTWTLPTSVYNTVNPTDINITGWVAASYLNFGSPMTITGVSTDGSNTIIAVESFVSGEPIVIAEGKNRDNLQFVLFAETGTMFPNGAGQIPYNMYESFIQSRGDFEQGVQDVHGAYEKVNINGLGYGYAFSDFMGLSSTISVNALTTPEATPEQSSHLLVTMQPWFNDAPVVVTYDIDSVTFESQAISGWSLFGSGADQVTITTTANSTPFNLNASYGLAFGGLNATGMATGANTLTVSVPSLTSLWTGVGGSDFANLSFVNANSTTGNTSFAVLPVNLTVVAPDNGSVTGNTALMLNASSKQYGFGNATNLSVFFSRNGVTAGATNVAVVDPTTLSFTTPAVGEPGNWTLGVYKDAAATVANLASNNLTYAFTEGSQVFLSGDYNADGLTDIATLLDDGNWQVSFTQAAGNATLVSLNAANHWTTNATWVDWSVLRSGDRDMIVARAEVPNEAGSWWKLSYDGTANGTSATDFSTNFVGSWDFSGGVQWLDVVNGDFDGDGNADIIGRNSSNNQWWMLANATQNSNGATFGAKNVYLGAWSSEVQWDQTLAGNFLGDPGGKTQVAGLTGSTWWISEYEGTPGSMNHTVMTTQWGRHQNYTDYLVGNFDGNANGAVLIAAKTGSNAWYSIGSNTSVTPQNNTPSLMGLWPDHTATYSDVVVGDFLGTGNGTVGIAGLQRSNGNLSWWVLERPSVGANYSVQNFGSWPRSTLAQAFAGLYSAGDVTSGRTGVLGRTQQGGIQVWDRGVSNGTAFAVSPVAGYPEA